MAATVVLVHGGFDGPWTWQLLGEELERRGVPHLAADLPSCRASGPTVDVHDDARYVRELVEQAGGPAILVGNSYGGAVITEAGAEMPSVKHLVYVAALMPLQDEPILGIVRSVPSDELTAAITARDDGLLEIDIEADIALSFAQAPPEALAIVRSGGGRPMSVGQDVGVAVRAAAWRTVPSTYVVCGEDRSLPATAQRAWAQERATTTIEQQWDHCPQLSHPAELADILERIARETR
jgi:pimeloyl-ACP methyl ester carboxylesterase